MLARKCYPGYWEQLVQRVRKGKWLPCNAQTARACMDCAFISLFCTQSKTKPAPLVEWVSISRFGLVARFSKYTFGTPGSLRHFREGPWYQNCFHDNIKSFCVCVIFTVLTFVSVVWKQWWVTAQNKVVSPTVLVVIFICAGLKNASYLKEVFIAW